MIMTVITQDGQLAAAAVGDMRWSEVTKRPTAAGQFRAGVSAEPNQTVKVVEVPDKFAGIYADPLGLMAELGSHLKRNGLL
jgi:hypothetical protein